MGKEKKGVNTDAVRELTEDELAVEEKKYNACKIPVKIGFHIYAFAIAVWILNGLIVQAMDAEIPRQQPIVEQLNHYKQSEKYTDFIAEAQRDALRRLEAGEITLDEYDYVIKTLSNDAKFEEFLRTIQNDAYVQQRLKEYDEYKEARTSLGRKYATLNITSLGSLLVGTIILAKYRFREMDIEEARTARGGYKHFIKMANSHAHSLMQEGSINYEDYTYVLDVLSNDEYTCKLLKEIRASNSMQDKIAKSGACATYSKGEVQTNKDSMGYLVNYFVCSLLEKKHGFLDGIVERSKPVEQDVM